MGWPRRVGRWTPAIGIALLLVALVGFAIGLAQAQGFGIFSTGPRQARALDVYGKAPAFTLTDQLERSFSSDELRGKVVVANFVYTHCSDVCPLLSLRMQALQERLRQENMLDTRVQLLSFTVDAARDTPAVLRAYADRYRPDSRAWRFLTGPEAEMQRLIVQGFMLGVQKAAPATSRPSNGEPGSNAYEVMHSARFVLIDRQGRIRAYYDGRELDLDRVARDIRQLLNSG